MIAYVLALLWLLWLVVAYLQIRNGWVYLFLSTVLKAVGDSEHEKELLPELERTNYDKMLFSFKPLRIECWYSEDFCKKLNNQ